MSGSGRDTSGKVPPVGEASSSWSPHSQYSQDQDHDQNHEQDNPTSLAYLHDSPTTISRDSTHHTPHHSSPPSPPPFQSIITQPTPGPRDKEKSRETSYFSESWNAESSKPKRRPAPLDLSIGSKPDSSELAMPLTGSSMASTEDGTLSDKLENLSVLRKHVKQNLVDRPLTSITYSDSEPSSGRVTPDPLSTARILSPIPDSETILITDVNRIRSEQRQQMIVLDTRSFGDYSSCHLESSVNISIPSLIFKRFRKNIATNQTWEYLSSFITTPEGKEIWQTADLGQQLDVVIVGSSMGDEIIRVLRDVIKPMIRGDVWILRGAWDAVLSSTEIQNDLTGQSSVNAVSSGDSNLSAPASDTGAGTQMDTLRPHSVIHHPSMPSLRTDGRLPVLATTTRPTPRLSLNVERPARSASLPDSSEHLSVSPGFRTRPPSGSKSPGLSIFVPPRENSPSFQALCHEQSKLPPSPSSFGNMKPISAGYLSTSPWSDSTARPDGPKSAGLYPTWRQDPGTSRPHPRSASFPSSRAAIEPFIVSTILPNFLYLGPEIVSLEEVEELKQQGVKRVLNVAIECHDPPDLNLASRFEKYHRLPMKDVVEDPHVPKYLREAVNFLDDARLHSAPVYVHCKAGKSRSVTVVLAYLIHANAWTLKTSYAYVAERRKGISPNIGFVAELMQFEEGELGLKQSGGVHGETAAEEEGDTGTGAGGSGGGGKGKGKKGIRHMRDSLPPAWASTLDSKPPRVDLVNGEGEEEEATRHGEEREVRKDGQWVHHRRTPVDRKTLQPGRRVSKAGLESLRPMSSTNSSPTPSPRIEEPPPGRMDTATPDAGGRLGWL